MTTTTTTTVPQLRLPGQTAAPEGPVDMLLMYVMHHAFRRDLAAFSQAVRLTPSGDRTTWRALADRWALFADVLHHHHSGEDAGLWPELLVRSGDADRATLEAMEAEHAEIDPLLEGCAAGFATLAEHDDEDARRALAVRVTATRESLGRHLRHEETDAIAILQRVLTQADWDRIDEEHLKNDDMPFSKIVGIVPWVAYGVPSEHHARIFGTVGRGFWLVWLATRGRFARNERRAFRYLERPVTP
jgi:hemerythrin-like domain-containing protein